MINIENIEVFGWEAAIRGMRNPMNSWDKCDSEFDVPCNICDNPDYNCKDCQVKGMKDRCLLGKQDLELMCKLSRAGSDHGKFLRMINVTMDILAPLYWWKEFDTYKVGTVANSCSTMHKLTYKEFTVDDFSHEHLDWFNMNTLTQLISQLNQYRNIYINGGFISYPASDPQIFKANDKYIWWQMIQMLPTSYNQRRTVQLNYQVCKDMYFARKDHKLDEWQDFCHHIINLPYFKQICISI